MVGVVCARFWIIAGETISLVVLGADQIEPAKITILSDGRLRYEEHLFDKSRNLGGAESSYQDVLTGNGWKPRPDNAPPRLRYETTEDGVAYLMSIDLRTGVLTADASPLYVDATIETAAPVR